MIQIRDDGDRRELIGVVVPYGETIPTGRDRTERFRRGVFADATADPSRVKLYVEHPREAGDRTPVGVAVELEDRDDGLHGVFRVPRTVAGDDTLELVRSGVLTDLSVGFAEVAGGSRYDGRTVEHRRAMLDHVALTYRGAYPSARVLATRTAEHDLDITDPDPPTGDDMTAPEPTLPDDTSSDESPDNGTPAPAHSTLPADVIATRMASLEDTVRRIGAGAAPAPTRRTVDPVAWFTGEVRALATRDPSQRIDVRALADITGDFPGPVTAPADLSPFVVEQLLGAQLVNVLDTRRPIFAHGGAFTMPRSGFARIPAITQHTKVALRTGQKEPANTQAMQAALTSYEAQWFDGAVDVALEWLATAEPPALELVWRDLLGQYALATEDAAGAALETSGTATGAVLPTNTYAAFAKAVATQAIEVRKATGAPADALAIPEALWPDVVAMVDASDRRIFATTGPANADGSVALNAESFTMPTGIDVFYAPGITAAVLFNGDAFLTSDGGPSRVEAVNVELMGRDIGVLGRVMMIPRIATGIRVFRTVAGATAKASDKS
jgi:HK97 family phage prohead protease